MSAFNAARKTEIQAASQQLVDLLNDTDPTPDVNPLQAQLDQVTAERDAALATLATVRTSLETLLSTLPPAA